MGSGQNMNTLFIKLGGIGDLLMVTPGLRAYKKTFPKENIIFLTGDSNKAVLKNNPYIDQLIQIDDTAIFSTSILQRLKAAVKLLSFIKRSKIHKVFVLHRDCRWNFLVFLSGIKERHGFKRDLHGLFLTHAVSIVRKEHQIFHYLKVLGMPLPSDIQGMRMEIFPEPQEEARIENFMCTLPSRNIIAIAPGGAVNTKEQVPLKRWPIEYYRELMRLLLGDGFIIFLIGGEKDFVITKQITDAFKTVKSKQLIDISGRYSLSETYALLKKCLLMITHDCGPMHIASTAEIPVITIFGPTDPNETKPLNPGSFVFWRGNRLSCAPCYKNGKFPDCKTMTCMKEVTPSEVYEKVKEVSYLLLK